MTPPTGENDEAYLLRTVQAYAKRRRRRNRPHKNGKSSSN
jgi:cytochrome c553